MNDPEARLANRLGALALEAAGRMDAATRELTELSPSQVAALNALGNFAFDQPQSVLGDVLGLSQPATARVLDRLEGAGLARRERGRVADGRELRVSLTGHGRRLAGRIAEARLQAIIGPLRELPHGSRASLGRAVEQLLAGVTESRRDARRICRRCEPDVCGHPDNCPVTQAADRAESRRV